MSLQDMQLAQETMMAYTGWEGPLLFMVSERQRANPDNNYVLNRFASVEELIERTDENLFNTISQTYEVDIEHAKDLFEQSMNGANEMLVDIANTALAGDNSTTFGLRNEILTYPNSFGNRLVRLGKSYRDQGERIQLLSQILPAETFLHFFGAFPRREVKTQLYQFGEFLNEHFFASGEGATGFLEFTAWHDDETNQYAGIAKRGEESPGFHAKKHKFLTRELQNGGQGIFVLTNPRTKSYITAAEKAWGKALKNGGLVRPTIDVEDFAGLRITTMGGVHEREYVFEKIVESLNQYGGGYIRDFDHDEKIDGRSNSKGIDWRRLKVHLHGVDFPIEVIVEDLEVYVNGQYYIGDEKDPRKPKAHLEFERERAETLFRFFFSEQNYQSAYNTVDVEGLIQKRKDDVRETLLKEKAVPESELFERGFMFTPQNQSYNTINTGNVVNSLEGI